MRVKLEGCDASDPSHLIIFSISSQRNSDLLKNHKSQETSYHQNRRPITRRTFTLLQLEMLAFVSFSVPVKLQCALWLTGRAFATPCCKQLCRSRDHEPFLCVNTPLLSLRTLASKCECKHVLIILERYLKLLLLSDLPDFSPCEQA